MPFPFDFWDSWEGWHMQSNSLSAPLAERPVGYHDATRVDESPGKRLRVFASLVQPWKANGLARKAASGYLEFWIAGETDPAKPTYQQAYDLVAGNSGYRELFANFPLRISINDSPEMIFEIPSDGKANTRDPELHGALQDLGDEINEDIREACFAFDDPNVYYPGVDEGIEPVTDEHVNLVIWAMQRELNRELRPSESARGPFTPPLPAVPLSDLPWRIQRALAERRRLRYLQWGITSEVWHRGTWSLWDIPEDPDYVPRRSARILAQG